MTYASLGVKAERLRHTIYRLERQHGSLPWIDAELTARADKMRAELAPLHALLDEMEEGAPQEVTTDRYTLESV